MPETLVSDTDPLAGHTTYRLIAKTKTDYITTIYGARCLASCVFHTNAHSTHSWRLLFAALYGDNANPMTLPAAYHVDAPFGVNIGGVNPAFFSINPDVQYDSWLTVGITGGNVHNSISSIGIDWDAWTETSKSFTDDGVCRAGFLPVSPLIGRASWVCITHRRPAGAQAVFWMDPTVGPKFADAAAVRPPRGGV